MWGNVLKCSYNKIWWDFNEQLFNIPNLFRKIVRSCQISFCILRINKPLPTINRSISQLPISLPLLYFNSTCTLSIHSSHRYQGTTYPMFLCDIIQFFLQHVAIAISLPRYLHKHCTIVHNQTTRQKSPWLFCSGNTKIVTLLRYGNEFDSNKSKVHLGYLSLPYLPD